MDKHFVGADKLTGKRANRNPYEYEKGIEI